MMTNGPGAVTPYRLIGGERAVRELVDRFYEYMDTLPEAQDIRAMHPVDLASSRDKLFMFLSGWLGGPELYQQAFGHPRLRMRHFPFSIGIKERNQWLLCMCKALDDMPWEPALRKGLARAFAQLANHMINQGE